MTNRNRKEHFSNPGIPGCRRVPMTMVVLAWLISSTQAAELSASDVRTIINLDSPWIFHWSEGNITTFAPDAWTPVTLPHTWNVADGSQVAKPYRRGVGYYQRSITIPDAWRGRSVFLTVGAANAKAAIVINQQQVAEHRTGFTAFTTDLTSHLKPTPEQALHIEVDNRPNTDYPPLVSDYTFFGGIHRSVWLTVTDPVHVSLTDHSSSGVYLRQQQVSHERAAVDAQVVVANDLAVDAEGITVTAEVIGDKGAIITTVTSDPLTLRAKSSDRVSLPLVLERPRLWDGRNDPYCYQVRVRIHHHQRVTDEVIQPLGLRFFEVDPARGFLLNGRPYPLHGTALHQDHAGKGWAVSDADRTEDVALLTEVGATCVRLVHYPHAPATLDLLDRAGIVAWSEIPIAYRLGKLPAFEENCQTMLTEMICQLYNHPSICFWGLYNEISGTRPDPLRLITELHQQAKKLDPVRLTTGAAGSMENDPICEVTDLSAFNRYFGWFIPGADLMAPWASSVRELYPKRCIGLAEYGGEGNPTRHADWRTKPIPVRVGLDSRMGTEEFQSQLHEELWLQLSDQPHLWCKISWLLADWSSGGTKTPSIWPADGVGKMGLVSYDRKLKKDVFYWYKASWSKEPVLYIAERRFTQRTVREFDLRVYSNLKADLTVTINGAPLAAAPDIQGARYLWSNLRVPAGAATVVVSAKLGDKTITDSVVWNFPNALPPPQVLRPEDAPPKPETKPDF